ncbi:hypothetical protein [Azospirillum endophyticum]
MKMPFSFAHLRPGAAAGPTVPPGTKPASGATIPPAQSGGPQSQASGDEKPKDGDEEEDDGEEDKQARTVRRKERERCAAIFASPAATGRVEMAATLAFGTDLTAQQAIAVLETAPAAAAPPPAPAAQSPANPLAAAMAALGNPPITPDGGASAGGDDVSAEVAAIMNLHAAHNGTPAK